MAWLLIPVTKGVPFQSRKVRLEERDYLLDLKWNERESRWYLDIRDEEGTEIRAGLKLVANWRLLRFYHFDTNVPAGELVVRDSTGDGSPPGLDELGPGLRCELLYRESTT